MKVALEYYFEPVGLISVTAFRRDFENMFGQTVVAVTPDFLSLYGLDPATYGEYDVSTQYNLPVPVRTTGVSLNYKQALTFLPQWARGVSVFANGKGPREFPANLAPLSPLGRYTAPTSSRATRSPGLVRLHGGGARRTISVFVRSLVPNPDMTPLRPPRGTLRPEVFSRPLEFNFASRSCVLAQPFAHGRASP